MMLTAGPLTVANCMKVLQSLWLCHIPEVLNEIRFWEFSIQDYMVESSRFWNHCHITHASVTGYIVLLNDVTAIIEAFCYEVVYLVFSDADVGGMRQSIIYMNDITQCSLTERCRICALLRWRVLFSKYILLPSITQDYKSILMSTLFKR